MISGLVLKYLNGERFVIRRGYETTLPVSSSFCLTVPVLELIREKPRCTQKYIVDTIGKDQGQVAKAIDRVVEISLVSKKNFTLPAL